MDGQAERDSRRWAREEFGHAELGDARRRARLVGMAGRAAQSPAGRVTEVFSSGAERQGAYDFLESPHVHADALSTAMRTACIDRCRGLPFVFVPVDGCSVSLVDWTRKKDFGGVGNYANGGRGLKIIDAIAVSPGGVPLGICALHWWTRPHERPQRADWRPATWKLADKETHHWVDAIGDMAAAFRKAAGPTRAWFQIDREGDAWPILRQLAESGEWFTVRARSNRRLLTATGPPLYMRDAGRRAALRGTRFVEVSGNHGRRERLARLVLRATTVTLDMRDAWTGARYPTLINVVFVEEKGTTPRGEKPLRWTLMTNRPIDTLADVDLVVEGYAQRWRIEEFHRAWKSGVCRIESMQLRGKAAATKWATMLAAVALRTERLKRLAREQPDEPATIELSPTEIDALRLLKERQKSKVEVLPDRLPTIGEAVRWIADLGGYTGKSSGGPPGSTVIARGLERISMATEILEALRDKPPKR